MIDARGLSCPEPVILLRKEMKEHPSERYEIMVDNRVSVENISRLASKERLTPTVTEDAGTYTVVLS
ncbi:MAG: sulfurtransferase TusA family protein [Lachnospiraceae bacterium]|nr:sulfurtransferase TusA family protein [Lachnospiraceae bacterium]